MSSTDASAYSKPLLIVGTSLSTYLSGMIASISWISIPAILDQPTNNISLHVWRAIFDRGKAAAPPFALTIAAVNFANAYLNRGSPSRRPYYFVSAAVSTIAIVPFTLLVMQGNIDELSSLEEAAKGAGNSNIDWTHVSELIRHWGRLNLMRSVFPAIGALLGLMAP